MVDNRNVSFKSGWPRSDAHPFVIPNGADGSDVAVVDLLRGYWAVAIECLNANGIAGATTFSLKVSYDTVGELSDLQTLNFQGAFVSATLPAGSGETFGGVVLDAVGVQRLQIILDNVSTAEVTFNVWGIDAGVGGE